MSYLQRRIQSHLLIESAEIALYMIDELRMSGLSKERSLRRQYATTIRAYPKEHGTFFTGTPLPHPMFCSSACARGR